MKILKGFWVVCLLLGGDVARTDAPSVHGMVLFGSAQATYASHLPMFHAPHDRQVVLKINLHEVPLAQTLSLYHAMKNSGKTLFTLEPQVMDLGQIVNGKRTEFLAALFDGHFERGGKKLGPIRVKVEKVVLSLQLNAHASTPENEKYFVFGQKGEYFAAHLIEGKPSFDALLEVSQPYTLDDADCRTRVCREPKAVPTADEALPLTLTGPPMSELFEGGKFLTLGSFFEAHADVKKVIYLEQGDLSH